MFKIIPYFLKIFLNPNPQNQTIFKLPCKILIPILLISIYKIAPLFPVNEGHLSDQNQPLFPVVNQDFSLLKKTTKSNYLYTPSAQLNSHSVTIHEQNLSSQNFPAVNEQDLGDQNHPLFPVIETEATFSIVEPYSSESEG